jgi:hypothetical protein
MRLGNRKSYAFRFEWEIQANTAVLAGSVAIDSQIKQSEISATTGDLESYANRPYLRRQRVESSHRRSLSLRVERGNHSIYFCELLRVTVRLGAMRGPRPG